MSVFDLNGRVFTPIHNSSAGQVSDETRFYFSQDGDTITAIYSGGDIEDGHILGQFVKPGAAQLLYHCQTRSGELKAGQAEARFSVKEDGRLTIDMQWQWINGDKSAGTSHYEEVKS